MKKILMVLGVVPILAMGQQNAFTVNGAISGIKNKSLVSLTDLNNPTDTLAKSIVANNAFQLKGMLREPTLCNLNLGDVQKKTLLFLDNSMVTLSGNTAEIQKIKVE